MVTLEQYQRDREVWRQRWYQKGFFGPDTVAQVLEKAIQQRPDTEFAFYHTAETAAETRIFHFKIGELWAKSRRVANGLRAEGVRANEVIAIQMPTWYETVLVYLAAFQIGAIVLPIVHIYGPREVEFILRQSKAKTLVIPHRWHKVDFIERFRKIGTLPDLERVVVVGGDTPPDMVAWQRIEENKAPPLPVYVGDPDSACTLIYTSGTTSSPKGVLYSHNNLQSEWHGPFFATKGPYLCNFPAGHIAGFNFVLRPMVQGIPMVFFDHWDPELAAEAIEKYRVQESGGTGFFLRGLLRYKHEKNLDFSSLKLFSMGGTGVTPAEIKLAEDHGFKAGRGYGSTEHSTVTMTSLVFPFDKRSRTDGRLLPGVQARIVDGEGNELPVGAQGEIVTQGPELFIGYMDPELNQESFLPGGWFCTGDIGRLDEEGFLTITDRKKDVIIRGGENIASKEVEDILNSMPEVVESAATAMPDERYGEKVCAFVRVAAGSSLDLEKIRAFFADAGVARQKTPERLIVLEEFPRTPAGKVKKFELRTQLREEFAQRQALEKNALADKTG